MVAAADLKSAGRKAVSVRIRPRALNSSLRLRALFLYEVIIMSTIIETLFDTEWGVIIVGAIILTALIIEFFNNKPQI